MIKLPVCTENVCSNYDKLSKNLESKKLGDDSMVNTYKVVDEKTWERAMHCMIFRNSVEPAFCVTFDVDVTNFLKKIREQNCSFTLAFVYAVCKCANEIEAFRYRRRAERIFYWTAWQ